MPCASWNHDFTGASVAGDTRIVTSQGGNASPDVFYRLTLPAQSTVTVSTCGSEYDTVLMIYAGTRITTSSTAIAQ